MVHALDLINICKAIDGFQLIRQELMSREKRLLMLLQWKNFLHSESSSKEDLNDGMDSGDEFGLRTINNPNSSTAK